MKYERFEDLPCWQKARELCKVIFELINKSPFSKDFDLCGYTSDCATHEKEKDYHESTKYRKHEKNISNLIV
jgi:hypothetical protein